MAGKFTRRGFMQRGAAATAVGMTAALASPRARGANERIRVGVIGTANRGGQLIDAILELPEQSEIVALCDVDTTAMDKQEARLPGPVSKYQDYRQMIEREELDAVVIATPDHWHALQTIHACEAGLDVFVEKPLTMTIHEGRKMIEVARRTGRVVQVGLHRRSSELYHELHDYVQSGEVGKVTVARAYRLSNMYPTGIGRVRPSAPPDTLDWDLWLGPRAYRPFQETIHPYRFRWWDEYSSQVGNWGVHYFDLIRWMLEEEAPSSVVTLGGNYAVQDDRTIPDTLETTFEFASGRLLVFGQYEASGHPMFPFGDIELRGTQGCIYSSYRRFEVRPERGGQYMDREPRMEAVERTSEQSDPTTAHMRNFFDCMKTRETPNCDVEEGHRSTVFAHLANIALATRQRLDWDPVAERFTNHEAANEHLHYPYREPWVL